MLCLSASRQRMSSYGLSDVRIQIDHEKMLGSIAFAGKCLSMLDQAPSPPRREASPVIRMIEYFDIYLEGCLILLLIGHEALKVIFDLDAAKADYSSD